MRYGRRTLSALTRALEWRSHAELGVLFFEHGFEEHDAAGANKLERSCRFVAALERETSPQRSEEIFLELTEDLLRDGGDYMREDNPHFKSLLRALELEGLIYSNGRLIPTTPAPTQAGPHITALEEHLAAIGFSVAVTHYRQAVDNFVSSNYEAANGQLRSFVEDLYISLSRQKAGSDASNAPAALQYLRNRAFLDDPEFQLAKAYWSGIQSNGPHRGLSDHEEALFRLHTATALSRYLLSKTG